MKDIPMFTTEFGIASLVLNQIPYRGDAYIHLRATENPEALLEECIGFCRACGAEQIYATGHAALERYPLHTAIIKMHAPTSALAQTDAALFPVIEETLTQWRNIYNEKMANVPISSYMSIADSKAMLRDGGGYFVHRDGQLLGIGKICGSKIDAIAAVVPGAGRDVMLALCSLIHYETVSLETASTNEKALGLYEKLGFLPVGESAKWYQVFPDR